MNRSTARLTPEQRSLKARIAAHELHARGGTNTKAATAASPADSTYWERQVDPDGQLDPAERAKRAGHAKSAHFVRLAFLSSKARSKGTR